MLKWIRKISKLIICTIFGVLIGISVDGKFRVKVIEEKDNKLNKFTDYFRLFDKWMSLKEENKTLEKYFIDKGYHHIALYGMGVMGKHLINDLEGSAIVIDYVIDKKADVIESDLPILSVDSELPNVDAIIVTATFDFYEISRQLYDIVPYPIISLHEVIDDRD